jgi:hypothetical protein
VQLRNTINDIQERERRKKDIKDSFLRFKRLKKNNYCKIFSSQKRQVPYIDDRRLSTLHPSNKKEVIDH